MALAFLYHTLLPGSTICLDIRICSPRERFLLIADLLGRKVSHGTGPGSFLKERGFAVSPSHLPAKPPALYLLRGLWKLMSNKSICYKSLKAYQETDYAVSPFLALPCI